MSQRLLSLGGLVVAACGVLATAGEARAYDCNRAQALVAEARAIQDAPAEKERKLRQADRLCPNYTEPSLLLGDLYKEQGLLSRAKQAYARAGVAGVNDTRAHERMADLRIAKRNASLRAADSEGAADPAASDDEANFPDGTRVVRERVGGVEIIRPAVPNEALGGAEEDAVPSRASVTVEGGVQVIRPFRPGVKAEDASKPAPRVSAADLAELASLIGAADASKPAAPAAAAQRSEQIEILGGGEAAAGAEPRVREIGGERLASVAPEAAPLGIGAEKPTVAEPAKPVRAPEVGGAEACAKAEGLYKEGVALADGSVREEFAYQKALELCPTHAESHNALGVVYVVQKKWGMAESAFRRATEAQPGFAKAWFNLGSLYEQSGEFTRSIDAFLSAIDADKTYVKSYPRLANLYLRFGNAEAAIQHLERMLAVAEDADAHYQLGTLYWKKGDKKAAATHVQAAVKMNPDLLNKPEAGEILTTAF